MTPPNFPSFIQAITTNELIALVNFDKNWDAGQGRLVVDVTENVIKPQVLYASETIFSVSKPRLDQVEIFFPYPYNLAIFQTLIRASARAYESESDSRWKDVFTPRVSNLIKLNNTYWETWLEVHPYRLLEEGKKQRMVLLITFQSVFRNSGGLVNLKISVIDKAKRNIYLTKESNYFKDLFIYLFINDKLFPLNKGGKFFRAAVLESAGEKPPYFAEYLGFITPDKYRYDAKHNFIIPFKVFLGINKDKYIRRDQIISILGTWGIWSSSE